MAQNKLRIDGLIVAKKIINISGCFHCIKAWILSKFCTYAFNSQEKHQNPFNPFFIHPTLSDNRRKEINFSTPFVLWLKRNSIQFFNPCITQNVITHITNPSCWSQTIQQNLYYMYYSIRRVANNFPMRSNTFTGDYWVYNF